MAHKAPNDPVAVACQDHLAELSTLSASLGKAIDRAPPAVLARALLDVAGALKKLRKVEGQVAPPAK